MARLTSLAPEWIERVLQLPPDEQIKEITAEMKHCDPRWNGFVTLTIADGQVCGIVFDSRHVKDLSPIVASTDVKERKANSLLTNSELSDLSPLATLKSLTAVHFGECEGIDDRMVRCITILGTRAWQPPDVLLANNAVNPRHAFQHQLLHRVDQLLRPSGSIESASPSTG